MLAAVAGNRHDQELDIILLSAQRRPGHQEPDAGLRQGPRASSTSRRPAACAATSCRGSRGRRSATASRTSCAPRRTRRSSSRTSSPEDREADRAQDGRRARSRRRSARTARRSRSRRCRTAIGDIFTVDLGSEQDHERHEGHVRRLRADVLARRQDRSSTRRASAATTSCSGRPRDRRRRSSSRSARTTTRRPKFYDDHTIVFTSTATDPNVPLSPEVAQERRHPERLDARPDERRAKQWTDTATGNVSPVVLHQTDGPRRSRSSSYYKGEYGIHIDRAATSRSRRSTSATSASPGPVDRLPAADQPHAAAATTSTRRARSRR